MKQSTLELLACPVCHGPLTMDAEHSRMVCDNDRIAFEIREGILSMLPSEAVPLNDGMGEEK